MRERRRAAVVGEYPQRRGHGGRVGIVLAGQGLPGFDKRPEAVGFVVGVHVLQHGGDAFKPCAGVRNNFV